MDYLTMELISSARPETRPEIPRKLRWKARIFGKYKIEEYMRDYYERESGERVPFYLPYIFMKENFDYIRRYGKIPRHQISMVLIDGNDARTDYFLMEFLEELNFLTIVTERKEYFENLQERAFQELGLLIELVRPWETKNLRGNLVWDFTEELQNADCYPEESICFMPHKKIWKVKEALRMCKDITAVSIKWAEISGECIFPWVAETLLVPAGFPFRQSRCEELQEWCEMKKWTVKLRAETLGKP